MKNIDIRLVTIDGSTQKTGIAYFCNGKYVEHILLDYSKDKNMESRFESMSKAIWGKLNEYRPNIIYIEETYMANNPQTTKILTRLQGVVYAWCICLEHKCEFNTIKPTQWRKILNFNQSKNIKRNELKEQSIRFVLDNYGLEVTDDESDAICIGDAVLKKYGEI